MKYRWKLLLLLMAIAMVPIIFGRTFGVREVRNMGSELLEKTRQRVEEHARERQEMLTHAYSRILAAERRRLVLALEQLVRSVQKTLAQQRPSTLPAYTVIGGQPVTIPGATVSARYQRPHSTRFRHELTISNEVPVILRAPGVAPTAGADDIARLPDLQGEYQRLQASLGESVLWIGVYLDNGLSSVFPGASIIPRQLDYRQLAWYRKAIAGETAIWSGRFVDPITKRHTIALALRFQDATGMPRGVAAFTISMEAALGRNPMDANLPPGTVSLICSTEQTEDDPAKGIRIYLRSDGKKQQEQRWKRQIEAEWLSSDDPAQLAAILRDMEAGHSGTCRMAWNGRDSLWTYSPLEGLDSALVLITPYEMINKPVASAEKQIGETTDALIASTGLAGSIMLVVVILLAFWFATTVTRPLATLLKATQQLAAGDFGVKVHIRTRDEFSQLGAVFNRIGPRLREHAEMRQSLTLAREVQETLFPEEALAIKGAEIAGKSLSCDETGGDYFDYVFPPDGSGHVIVVVGDVSGHGIPATLLMTTVRASLRQSILQYSTPSAIVEAANRQLAQDVESSGRFMTLFLCQVDAPGRTLRWVRAGHEPALLFRPAANRFRELSGSGMALGIWEDTAYADNTVTLEKGDIIAIGTDGIWECPSPEGGMFGKQAFYDLIRRHAGDPACDIRDAVLAGVARHRGKAVQEDDITLVVIRIL
jgi:sigma-B regulation protein RsbU (phosphoserine phosphatase)